jgi:hypothetical protein
MSARGWTSSDVGWRGGFAPYDLIKEATIAVVVVIVLAALLAALFSSPDPKPVTVRSWANADPADFLTTAAAELGGTSGIATYGPPYTGDNSAAQHLGPFAPARWAGRAIPIDTAQDFVIAPLRAIPAAPAVQAAVSAFERATPAQQAAWTKAFGDAAGKARVVRAHVLLPPGRYGPVAPMLGALLLDARSGGLDGALMTTPRFFNLDYTKPLLFLSDGEFVANKATADNLGGDQWGIMNEVGQWPGSWWLFPYTVWYQFKPGSTSPNADLLVFVFAGAISLLFIFLPWIPGLRDVPRLTRVHRLIWREHYRRG